MVLLLLLAELQTRKKGHIYIRFHVLPPLQKLRRGFGVVQTEASVPLNNRGPCE